jgi:hypothetical protein
MIENNLAFLQCRLPSVSSLDGIAHGMTQACLDMLAGKISLVAAPIAKNASHPMDRAIGAHVPQNPC